MHEYCIDKGIDKKENTNAHIKQTLASQALQLSLECVMLITPCYLKIFNEGNKWSTVKFHQMIMWEKGL